MDGFGFLGSIELGDNLFAFAGLSKAEADIFYFDGGFVYPGTLQEDSSTIGLGAHFPISDVADVFGTARFSHFEGRLDVPGLGYAEMDGDDMSYGIGARFLVTDALELSLHWEQNNASGSGVDTRQMSLGARYHLNDQLAFQILSGSLEPTEGTGEADILNFGLSYFF